MLSLSFWQWTWQRTNSSMSVPSKSAWNTTWNGHRSLSSRWSIFSLTATWRPRHSVLHLSLGWEDCHESILAIFLVLSVSGTRRFFFFLFSFSCHLGGLFFLSHGLLVLKCRRSLQGCLQLRSWPWLFAYQGKTMSFEVGFLDILFWNRDWVSSTRMISLSSEYCDQIRYVRFSSFSFERLKVVSLRNSNIIKESKRIQYLQNWNMIYFRVWESRW